MKKLKHLKLFEEQKRKITKEDLYNRISNVYQETGQGVPMFVAEKIGAVDLVNDMIKEGLLKIVTTPYSHLPDDVTICLTGVYCVEEEDKKK